ncbi:MAG TPA: VWA domain-containing protein [Nostocaceae cyanobacterium]|nr:VWA domain-containing protein [Nostocaceae cyanobacterium]
MNVQILSALNDPYVDVAQLNSQRQLEISIAAVAAQTDQNLPLNLCLILDQSASMYGEPLQIVNQAVEKLLDQLKEGDRISIITFASSAQVVVPNQAVKDISSIKAQLKNRLHAAGGTVIAEGLSLAITEMLKGTKGAVSQAFLLTDGHGESGLKIWKFHIGPNDNKRCLELAEKAARLNLTIHTLGFGNDWNQDLLEKISDAGGGTLTHIYRPEQAVEQFKRLFRRVQSVGLTNAYLLLSLVPGVRLAEVKPIAQVAPDTIELPVQQEPKGGFMVRLGDLMKDAVRKVLVNLYLGKLPEGEQVIGHIQVRYDDPAENKQELYSELIPVYAYITKAYQPEPNPEVQKSILTLAKYRQTQVAEAKLREGDRTGAATLLQSAAKTALQIGDIAAATVLQHSATRLQTGEDLTEAERKKTKIASKTQLQE